MQHDSSTFICKKCAKARDKKFSSVRSGICKPCFNYRPKHGDFLSFVERYYLNASMRDQCIKRCGGCGIEIKKTGRRHNDKYCATCSKQKRIEGRRRKAQREGKNYNPRGAGREKVCGGGLHYFIRRGPAFERHMDRLAERNAYEAFEWWLKNKANDATVRGYYADAPWRNPRLSEADRYKLRYAHDASFQIKERIRRQINKRRKRDGIADIMRSALNRGYSSSVLQDRLGYSLHHLMKHIELQFTDGMNWDAFKRGEIHIDHIIPQASFDLSDDAEWRKCWCLSNLRPTWARDNLKKGANIEFLI